MGGPRADLAVARDVELDDLNEEIEVDIDEVGFKAIDFKGLADQRLVGDNIDEKDFLRLVYLDGLINLCGGPCGCQQKQKRRQETYRQQARGPEIVLIFVEAWHGRLQVRNFDVERDRANIAAQVGLVSEHV